MSDLQKKQLWGLNWGPTLFLILFFSVSILMIVCGGWFAFSNFEIQKPKELFDISSQLIRYGSIGFLISGAVVFGVDVVTAIIKSFRNES